MEVGRGGGAQRVIDLGRAGWFWQAIRNAACWSETNRNVLTCGAGGSECGPGGARARSTNRNMLFQVRPPTPIGQRYAWWGVGGSFSRLLAVQSQLFQQGAGFCDCNRCDINKVELNFTFSSHLHMLEAGIHLRRWV